MQQRVQVDAAEDAAKTEEATAEDAGATKAATKDAEAAAEDAEAAAEVVNLLFFAWRARKRGGSELVGRWRCGVKRGWSRSGWSGCSRVGSAAAAETL